MDPVKRKVITELFLAPSVVLPIVGGMSAGILSWAVGGVPALTMAAVAGILGGLGWMATRIIFQIESITEAALQAQQQYASDKENRQLDELAIQFRTDGDRRTQDYLTLLRSLRAEFENEAHRATVREQVNEVFDAAVEQLKEAYRLSQLAEKLSGPARKKIVQDRELVLHEIAETIAHVHSAANQMRQLGKSEDKADMATLREELALTMQVAKRTEQRMRELNHSSNGEQFNEEFDKRN